MRADQEPSELLLPVHNYSVLLCPSQVPEEEEGEARQRCAVDGEIEQRLCQVRRSFASWKSDGEKGVSDIEN